MVDDRHRRTDKYTPDLCVIEPKDQIRRILQRHPVLDQLALIGDRVWRQGQRRLTE